MPIPCMIVSGFLGSGKTTLLRHLLLHAGTLRLCPLLVVNEAGAVDIDGRILAEYGAEQVTLLGGCLCCAKHGELASVLDDLLARDRGDLLLIECSGLASPREVVAATAPFVARQRLAPPVVLTVVDAARLQRQRLVVDLVKEQLAAADTILLNKQDRVQPDHRSAVEALVMAFAAQHALRYWTTQSRLSEAHLEALLTMPGNASAASGEVHAHHHHAWGSLTLPILANLSLADLRHQLHHLPTNLDRAKGIVHTIDAGWQLVQVAYGETEIIPWHGALPVDVSALVCLGNPAVLSTLQDGIGAMSADAV